jgi:hypothetical protein
MREGWIFGEKYALPHVAICVEETSAEKGEHHLSELGAFLKVLGFMVLKTSLGSAVNICGNPSFILHLQTIGTQLRG